MKHSNKLGKDIRGGNEERRKQVQDIGWLQLTHPLHMKT